MPTNRLPKKLWIYRRLGPRIFSAAAISNTIVLASLQIKGFPKPTTNDFVIWDEKPANYPGPIFSIFSIRPTNGIICYTMPNPDSGSDKDIPSDEAIAMRAWKYASQLGLDSKQLTQKPLTSRICGHDENGREATNQICGRGVYLSRQLDGICFWGIGDDSATEGFWLEIGSHGKIRSFSLNWPVLERDSKQSIASPQQIIACIRAHGVLVLPNDDETNYFGRIRILANAQKFSITKITPYYIDGVFGEVPTNDVPSKYVGPVAELEGASDLGGTNTSVRLLCPILSKDVVNAVTSPP